MTDSLFSEGRRAALERRRAMSQGKGALPPARERTRSSVEAGSAQAHAPAAAAAVAETTAAATSAAAPAAAAFGERVGTLTGRLLSMLRRQQASAGKGGLGKAMASSAPASVPLDEPAEPVRRLADTVVPAPSAPSAGHARARQLRAERAQQRASAPSRPVRSGRIGHPPKVVVEQTAGGQKVTGLKPTDATKVTGAEAGLGKPVSGTAYISPQDGASRAQPPKVGLTTTACGQLVSGTVIRSRVAVTGDEAGDHLRLTGDVDGSAEQDVTPREPMQYDGVAQFARQANPHGHSVFGTNLGRSLGVAASRQRDIRRASEVTEGGKVITGSAVGRSGRVTGDEAGACRSVTGDQYLAPARSQAECGGQGGGTASPARRDGDRLDPVTGSKVTVSSTWGSAKITGADVEHRPGVTGDEPGSCQVITGTPYQGPNTLYGWCDGTRAAEGEDHLVARASRAAVSGDVPLHADGVTGTARGAERAITGTPYYRDGQAVQDEGDALSRIDQQFSIASPQRRAQLQQMRQAHPVASAAELITGSFAYGVGKITGNVEFAYLPRRKPGDDQAAPRISGEGGTRKQTVTGDAWRADARVTGTDGPTAYERNPSERAGKPQAFAGARTFKAKAEHEEPRQIVTGMVGWSSKSAAKVTLSGGAQG